MSTRAAASMQVLLPGLLVGCLLLQSSCTKSGASCDPPTCACDPAACPPPAWDWRDAVVYQLEIDRFANGNQDNDAAVPGVETAANFQGGDLAGVLAKLQSGFFEDLGVDAICLSSVADGPATSGMGSDGHLYAAYQGLWPENPGAVDPRFGSLEDLQAVVTEAHARGIRVMLQYQLHHLYLSAPEFAQHQTSWFWPVCVLGEGCSFDALPDRTRGWLRDYLPTLNQEVTDAAAFGQATALQLIADSGVDGLWLRYVHFTDVAQTAAVRAAIAADVEATRGEPFLVLGDVFTGNPADMTPYAAPGAVVDGLLEFPLRAQMATTLLLRQGSMVDLGSYLAASLGGWNDATMATFIGDQELPRAISIADGLWTDAWANGKDRAWSNQPPIPATRAAFERLANAWALVLTIPGMPFMYYGDEIGLPGAGEPDNQRTMQFTGLDANQTWLRDRVKALIAIRSAHPALRRGTWAQVGADAQTLAYRLQDGTETIYVAINRSDSAETVSGLPAGSLLDLLGGPAVNGPSVTVPPRSTMVFATN